MSWTKLGRRVVRKAAGIVLCLLLTGSGCVRAPVPSSPAQMPAAREWGKPVAGLATGIYTEKEVYGPGEPVTVWLFFKSVGPVELNTEPDTLFRNCDIDVTLPGGRPAPLTLFGQSQKHERDRQTREAAEHPPDNEGAYGCVAPHDGREGGPIEMVNRLFDMSESGKYAIVVRYRPWYHWGPKDVVVTSNSVTVSIRERDH